MKMGFRWYGEGNDTITLDEIRQIPGVETMVWSLHHKQAGEVWETAEIDAEMAQDHRHLRRRGRPRRDETLDAEVVESVNVHESIKLGKTVLGLSRDEAIDNYITTLQRLGRAGVKVVCYNFMPVFDWLRTDLWHPLPDGSTALFYEKAVVDQMSPEKLIADMEANSAGLTLPGWEPERLAGFSELNAAYEGVTHEDMYRNYQYFLDAIIPDLRGVRREDGRASRRSAVRPVRLAAGGVDQGGPGHGAGAERQSLPRADAVPGVVLGQGRPGQPSTRCRPIMDRGSTSRTCATSSTTPTATSPRWRTGPARVTSTPSAS